MSAMQEAKEKYDSIEIPEEFPKRVQMAIGQATAARKRKSRMDSRRRRSRAWKGFVGAAAALVAGFTLMLNTSTAFAQEMSELPVIGAVAKVLTFRSYEETTDDVTISVEIPTLEMISEDTGLEDSINAEILKLCEQYVAEAKQRAEEYRTAFLETGGTEEEWAAHKIAIQVGYEIKSQTEEYLSFVVKGNENWSSAYDEERYYNLNLKSGKLVTLEELLGEDYINVINESITSQISQKEAELGVELFEAEEGGYFYNSVGKKFYMSESGNPVLVFDKYEIAPGGAGAVEFEITK